MKIPKLLFVTDIHIRPVDRHKEYQDVFEKMYDTIQMKQIDIVCIGGDVYHTKLNLSPEVNSVLDNFFEKLAELCTVVIIPGNHDCVLSNRDRLDALTPFINRVNKLNKRFTIHYLKDTGIYDIEGIKFLTESIIDNQKLNIDGLVKQEKWIGMLHGTFSNCVTDNGFTMFGQSLPEWTKRCDYVLVGDIHKRQTLDYK